MKYFGLFPLRAIIQCYVELPRENRVNLCGGMFTPAEITDGWALRVPQPALADVTKSSGSTYGPVFI